MKKSTNLEPYKYDIINYYKLNNKGIYHLSRVYHTSQKNVKNLLIKNGVIINPNPSKKYDIIEDYFDIINTPDKAYFLGFMYADAGIYNFGKTHGFRINLQEKDKQILILLSNVAFGGRPLSYPKWKNKIIGNKDYDGCSLFVGNKKLTEALIKNGCYPKKSFTLYFPKENQVPKSLLSHFIRGYFDGDGSIMMKKRYNKEIGACFNVICSINFGKRLFNILKNELNIKMSVEIRNGRDIMCCLVTTSKDSLIKLFDFLYKDSNEFRLERKYNKFLECLSKIKDKISHPKKIKDNSIIF